MIIVLRQGTSEAQTREVLAEAEQLGLRGVPLEVLEKPLIHVVAGPARRARKLLRLDAVEALVPTSGPRIRRRGRRFYPYHFINWSAATMLTLGVLVVLAGYFPPGVGRPIATEGPPAGLQPPWFLHGLRVYLGLFPARLAWLGWTTTAISAVLILILPWLEGVRGRRSAYLLVCVLVAGWFTLLLWGAF